MSESARKDGRDLATYLQSLPEAERAKRNEEERRRAEAEHRRFQDSFRVGKCFLCKHALTAFDKELPCPHWLLRPFGFTKWHFMEVARRYSCFQIQAFLRWVASEEAFGRNINDLREEGTGKLIELTIRYKTFEWSFSCTENDYCGHDTACEDSRRAHYHFQMRVNEQAFIKFSDFHVPFEVAPVDWTG